MHQWRERLPVVGNRRRHGLHKVVELIQFRIDDRLAQRLKAVHVERDVVVDKEDSARAVIAGVADVRQDAIEIVGVKIAAAHFDD